MHQENACECANEAAITRVAIARAGAREERRRGRSFARVLLVLALPSLCLLAMTWAASALAASAPSAFSESASSISETSATLSGSVDPEEAKTKWQFEISNSPESGFVKVGPLESLAFEDASYHPVEYAVTGLQPDTVYYFRLFVENELGSHTSESISFETYGAPSAETFAVHTFAGGSGDIRVIGFTIPHGFDTHTYFEYGKTTAYEETHTPSYDAGAGDEPNIVAATLTGLEPGVTYHYRLTATSAAAGNPLVHGEDRTFTVPVPGRTDEGTQVSQGSPCPNSQFRTGPSAALPDCRAYEQVTPVQKEGATEIFKYGLRIAMKNMVGEDGNHLSLVSPLTKWGPNVGPNYTDYLFSRTDAGWQMSTATPQPETGNDETYPELATPDLTQIAIRSGYSAGLEFTESPEVTFKVGPVGGPYTSVVSQLRSEMSGVHRRPGAWIAASRDFSTLVLQTHDHSLIGTATGTASGKNDLYEYRAGNLHQLNVTTAGATLGSCGATMPRGQEAGLTTLEGTVPNAVSSDGSHVFFYASPSAACPVGEEEVVGGPNYHLYMRVDGSETVDVCACRFLAANPQGTKVLIEKQNGATYETFLYDTGSHSAELLLSRGSQFGFGKSGVVSMDLTAFYFFTEERLTPEAPDAFHSHYEGQPMDGGDLYRYDIVTRTLRFVARPDIENGTGGELTTSPDGRYLYFASEGVAGAPGFRTQQHSRENLFRYDNATDTIQCLDCASAFNPEPDALQPTFNTFESETLNSTGDEIPTPTISSANGDYVFFQTTSALLPQDINGETPPESGTLSPRSSLDESISSDVYQWRKDGVDGCAQAQGCLALISSGTPGFMVLLLGTTPSGRDVFFSTVAQLAPSDVDSAIDVYDARIGGGYPPPPPPTVECEGDACIHPLAAPNDATPASEQLQGAGNEHPSPPAPASHCKKGSVLRNGKCVHKGRAKTRRHRRHLRHRGHRRFKRGGGK